jgi:hypothetical protein
MARYHLEGDGQRVYPLQELPGAILRFSFCRFEVGQPARPAA